MTRQLFDEVIGTPPPSTVDVHAVVRREKRARATRRGGFGIAALAALAVSAAMAVNGLEAPAGNPSEPATGAQPTQDIRFQLLADDRQSAEASAKKLAQALDAAVKRVSPTAAWIPFPGDASNPPYLVPIMIDGPDKPTTHFSGSTSITSAKGKGGVNLMVLPLSTKGGGTPKARPGQSAAPHKDPVGATCTGAPTCVEGVGPNGAKMVTITYDRKVNYTMHQVRLELPGGNLLLLDVSKDLAEGGPATLPLDAKEITAIAVEVGGQIKA